MKRRQFLAFGTAAMAAPALPSVTAPDVPRPL
ncbi:twin-arginine translocation signal domain-containing protein [Kribbella sp. CA-245084]